MKNRYLVGLTLTLTLASFAAWGAPLIGGGDPTGTSGDLKTGEYNIYILDGATTGIGYDTYAIVGKTDYGDEAGHLQFQPFLINADGSKTALTNGGFMNGATETYCKAKWPTVQAQIATATAFHEKMLFDDHTDLVNSCKANPGYAGVCPLGDLRAFAKNKCGASCSHAQVVDEYIKIMTDDSYKGAPKVDDSFCIGADGTYQKQYLGCAKKFCYCYYYYGKLSFYEKYGDYIPYPGYQDFVCTLTTEKNKDLKKDSKVTVEISVGDTKASFTEIDLATAENGWVKVAASFLDLGKTQLNALSNYTLTEEQKNLLDNAYATLKEKKAEANAQLSPATQVTFIDPNIAPEPAKAGGDCSLAVGATSQGAGWMFNFIAWSLPAALIAVRRKRK